MRKIKQISMSITDHDVSDWFNDQVSTSQALFLEYLLYNVKITDDFNGEAQLKSIYENIRRCPSTYATLLEFAKEILKPMPDKPAA